MQQSVESWFMSLKAMPDFYIIPLNQKGDQNTIHTIYEFTSYDASFPLSNLFSASLQILKKAT